MKRRKALSLLLILTILLSLVVPATSALADDDTSGGDGDKTKGMSISKTASYDEKTQKYTITLEAFATGEKITSVVSQDVPTDIVLVLDQSSSMTDPIGSFDFTEYKDETNRRGQITAYHTRNSDYYDCRHNGGSSNLWHKLADGTYVSVSVTMQESLGYTAITNGNNNSTWYGATNYWNNRNNLYALVNGEYQKVTVSQSGNAWYPTFTYTLPNNTTIATSLGNDSSPDFSGIDGNVLYLATADSTKTVYTYTYTDAAGNEQTIGTSTGATNTNFDDNTKITLYQRTVNANGGGTRLAAIQAAVTTFANAVHEKAKGIDRQFGTTDDVKHRIAMVGFATGDYSGNSDYPAYENTELFIGSAQYNYSADASNYYASAFQDMSTQEGYNNVLASKDVLAARGATRTDLGILMANEIFKANPLQPTEKRNRIMIVFTDGVPSSWSGYNSTVAQNAIDYAATAKTPTKDGGYGATVYGIGIFSGADATSAGSTGQGSDADKGNYFLQNVSSNNGVPQSPSYYLSAGDMGTLSSIFQQISGNIETGGSSTTLGSETVVKDIISPYFKLPEGTKLTDIRIDTYDCTGKTGDTYSWNGTSGGNGGATADIGTDGQVNVTGFDFSANWCGLDNGAPHGKKLVISFEVEPKSGFLGGNSVDTNGGAYIYENGEAQTPLMEFEKPIVNVPIPALTVGAEDKNVYLLGNVTAEQIRSGVKVSVGTVELNLDPTVPNYGLADWQTKYVEINITYKDAAGNVLTDRTGLTDDTTYSVEVTVTPKPVTVATDIGPTATEAKGSASGKINVFKPELTYKDSDVYYGAAAPELGSHLTDTKWKHGDTLSTNVTMLTETAPALVPSYAPDADKIVDGKINTKQDIAVDVTVKIGERDVTSDTTFVHTDCAGKTCTVPAGKEFVLHVKTCTLTITKYNGAADETYVFDVIKDGVKYSEVTIQGTGAGSSQTLVELPVGNYTIVENGGWSWRYTSTYDGNGNLSAGHSEGALTCTNKKGPDEWLNGYSDVTRNIYGFGTTTTANGNN